MADETVEERWARYDRERIEARQRHDLDEHPLPIYVPGCYRCRDRREEPRREVARQQALADERQMDWCRMRDSSVRRLPLSRTFGRKCYLCGKVLAAEADIKAPRRRRWCSDACSTLWWQNHAWSSASAERVRLDNHACVRCGTGRDTARTVCGRCETVWPCETARLYGQGEDQRMPGHWPTKSWMALEVNHKDPRVGRGYGNGCHHHLGRLGRAPLLTVLGGVGGERQDARLVLLQEPERPVAGGAQDAPDASRQMPVIYVSLDEGEARAADGARVTLRPQDVAILRGAQVVPEAEVASPSPTALRAEPHVASPDERGIAQLAGPWPFGDATPMPPLAPFRAVPGSLAVQWSPALDARLLVDRSVEGPIAEEPTVVHFAEAGSWSSDGLAAAGYGAWQVRHALIVVGVPLRSFPPPDAGLETLCHDCHVIETNRQAAERRAARIAKTGEQLGLLG